MINHYIIVASAYSIGKRIALDYTGYRFKKDLIQQDIDYIIEKCGNDVAISSHSIQTESESWDSVEKKDHFFKDVKLVNDKKEFVNLLLKDRELKGIDIAKYILSVIPSTHLKLQKLVYMCYADYLCEENEKLFEDQIFAYRLGPVIKSIYQKYKKSSCGILATEDNKITYDENQRKMSSKSRILASKNGLKKITSIDKTIKKYENYSASQLVELTHKKNTPWKKTGAGVFSNKIIKDELIKEYHHNEIY